MPRHSKHRANLVQTAMRLFRRQGFASTGLTQILAESGAPKGSLYHYFPEGKEALAEAAVALAGERMAEMLDNARARHPDDPHAFVKRYARTLAQWMAESDYGSGCPIATTLLETVPQNERIAAAGVAAFDRWIAIIASVFRSHGGSPSAAKKQAQLLVSAMEGALIVARVRRSKAPILDVGRCYAGMFITN